MSSANPVQGPEGVRPDAGASREAPDITLIVTLHDQRVDAAECVGSWTRRQNLDRAQYEVIVMSDGASLENERAARTVLGPQDRLVRIAGATMMGLYHAAAGLARARWLLFTEFHCVANHDCLQQALAYLDSHPELSGACLHSVGDDTNVFSRVERRLFEEQFAQWCTPDDWRKVMVRGVVIDREAYFDAGGFDARFTYFSDWILAAELHARGYRLGFAEKSSVLHYYNTRYDQFVPSVRARAREESAVRLERTAAFCDRYFDAPREWQERRFSSASFGRFACGLIARAWWNPTRLGAGVASKVRLAVSLFRWTPTALWGRYGRLMRARMGTLVARARCERVRSDEEALAREYLRAHRAIDRHTRLGFLHSMADDGAVVRPPERVFVMSHAPEERLLGLYAPEEHGGRVFRWSTDVAAIETGLPAGSYSFEIQLLSAAGRPADRLDRIEIDGTSATEVAYDANSARVSGRIAIADGPGRFAWVMGVMRPTGSRRDPRTLGLPIERISFQPLGECS